MGHASSIALGVAFNKADKKIWCIDGDGAVLMHMGAMALIGANKPSNFVYIVINNGAHETVGGMPTVAGDIDIVGVAKACGYPNVVCVDGYTSLDVELEKAKSRNELSLIEVKCFIGAREDLGRPTTTAIENKKSFMRYISLDLEQQFHNDMVEIYKTSKNELGYNATRFLQMLSEIGGFNTAKELIKKDDVSEGFIILWENGRLDLSVESYVLKDKYKELFSEKEIEICRKRLDKYK